MEDVYKRQHVGMVTEEEKAVYEKAKKIFDEMALVNCTKCAYCMPCPCLLYTSRCV